MANEGGTRGKSSGAMGSLGAGRFARSAALGAALMAGQQSAGRGNDYQPQSSEISPMGGDTELGESSVGLGAEEQRPSVLDAGAKHPSYAFKEEEPPPPMAGGGELNSQAMELDRQRAEEERMRQTQEQFVGSPETPGEAAGGGREQAPSGEVEGAEEGEAGPQPEAAEAEEDERPLPLFERQRAIEARKQQEAEDQAMQQQAEQRKQEAKKQMLDYIKMGNGGLSIETIAISLYIVLGIWNIQAINKYIFKSKMIPTQSEVEDFCCFTCDLFVCLNWLFLPPCFIGPTILVLALLLHLYNKVFG